MIGLPWRRTRVGVLALVVSLGHGARASATFLLRLIAQQSDMPKREMKYSE